MPKIKPRYPIYVVSKGRADICLTAKFLIRDEVDFRIVIEPQEYDEYVKHFDEKYLLTLPFSNLGLGSIPARNWIWQHATEAGFFRHWILDDNIRLMYRWHNGRRIPCDGNIATAATEDFVDRYENVAVAGLNYRYFAINPSPPFRLNCHVYSCLLIRNDIPYRWRGRYNEDTDLCLQVLSGGWCTVQMQAFLQGKIQSMLMKGGNTEELYLGDGRLKMAKALERMWPGVVSVGRRFNRPQHVINAGWRRFDTPLKRREDIDWDNFKPNEYGMRLMRVKDEIKSDAVKHLLVTGNN